MCDLSGDLSDCLVVAKGREKLAVGKEHMEVLCGKIESQEAK